MTITLDALAAEFAHRYGLDRGTARADVDALAGQLADDPALYNETSETVSAAGAELIRDQMAATH